MSLCTTVHPLYNMSTNVSVALCLKRQCDRTLGDRRVRRPGHHHARAADGGGGLRVDWCGPGPHGWPGSLPYASPSRRGPPERRGLAVVLSAKGRGASPGLVDGARDWLRKALTGAAFPRATAVSHQAQESSALQEHRTALNTQQLLHSCYFRCGASAADSPIRLAPSPATLQALVAVLRQIAQMPRRLQPCSS